MTQWGLAFAITVAVEVAVAVPLLGWLGTSASVGRRVAVVAAASAVTHPLLWLAVRAFGEGQTAWTVTVLIGELVVIAVEALVLIAWLPSGRSDDRCAGDDADRRGDRRGDRRADRALVAVVMNAASALVGLVVYAIG